MFTKNPDGPGATLVNKISVAGAHLIVARVYHTSSWIDGRECIVLDYSKTSLVAHWIRDEIRLIGPGFYLGRVYWDRSALIHFSLVFEQQ